MIGADYLWYFQEGRTIRGQRDEPVAVETSLGWVLSGPMKELKSSVVLKGQVNLVSIDLKALLLKSIKENNSTKMFKLNISHIRLNCVYASVGSA